MKKVNVICIKWGTSYSTVDVNKLYAAIKRNTSYAVDFYCFTEHSEGLDNKIIVHPLPELDVTAEKIIGTYHKEMGLCNDQLAGLTGKRVFFFDLDSLIVGNLDEFFDYPQGDSFYIINDWAHRSGKLANKVGQASCYSWVVGTLGYIKTYYENHPDEVIKQYYTAAQEYLSTKVIEKYGNLNFWPEDWFKSFKFHCIPHPLLRYFITPKMPDIPDLKMIAFHGNPNIADAIVGVWSRNKESKKYPHGLKKLYKHVRPTKWITKYWTEEA